jgi:DNA-directed RNA polymerase specialized sigma24 family protein
VISQGKVVEDFSEFARSAEPRLRQALCSRFGVEAGREATAEAMAVAWEHWSLIRTYDNPVGYLFGVGRNKAQGSYRRRRVILWSTPDDAIPWVEPGLPQALALLSPNQRTVVLLLHCFEWTHAEVAALLGISRTTIQNHAERGMARLRHELGVNK